MTNETEKNQQTPGQRQQGDPGRASDPTRRDSSQSGDVYNPQDPTKKNPGQSGDTTDRNDREESEDVERRRAS